MIYRLTTATCAAVMSACVLAACGAGAPAPNASSGSQAATPAAVTEHDLRVAIKMGLTADANFVPLPGANGDPNACVPGAHHQVTVTNQAGTVLGSADMAPMTTVGALDAQKFNCLITLDLGAVPAASQYGVTLDQSGPIWFSQAQAQSNGYELSITYGYQ